MSNIGSRALSALEKIHILKLPMLVVSLATAAVQSLVSPKNPSQPKISSVEQYGQAVDGRACKLVLDGDLPASAVPHLRCAFPTGRTESRLSSMGSHQRITEPFTGAASGGMSQAQELQAFANDQRLAMALSSGDPSKITQATQLIIDILPKSAGYSEQYREDQLAGRLQDFSIDPQSFISNALVMSNILLTNMQTHIGHVAGSINSAQIPVEDRTQLNASISSARDQINFQLRLHTLYPNLTGMDNTDVERLKKRQQELNQNENTPVLSSAEPGKWIIDPAPAPAR